MSQSASSPQHRQSSAKDRSVVWFTHIDTSGCGACTQSVFGLLAPHYAGRLRAEGIGMTRSPRHADIILISGALTRAARIPALRVLLAAPEPHALVAIGDCAINGCVFKGSPHLAESVAETLDVNIEQPGCPPTPDDILAAIIEAKRLLLGKVSVEDTNTAPTTEADDDVDEEDVDETDNTDDSVGALDIEDEDDTEEDVGEGSATPDDETPDDETPDEDEADEMDETGDDSASRRGSQA